MASVLSTSCNFCGKEVRVSYLYLHYKRYHKENPKSFSCDECPKNFFIKNRPEDHKKSSHPNVNISFGGEISGAIPRALRDNMCDQCDKTFVTDERLREHKNTMHRQNPIMFHCIHCNKSFENARVFKTHSRQNHLNFPCNGCDKKFGSARELKTHKKTKHGKIG